MGQSLNKNFFFVQMYDILIHLKNINHNKPAIYKIIKL